MILLISFSSFRRFVNNSHLFSELSGNIFVLLNLGVAEQFAVRRVCNGDAELNHIFFVVAFYILRILFDLMRKDIWYRLTGTKGATVALCGTTNQRTTSASVGSRIRGGVQEPEFQQQLQLHNSVYTTWWIHLVIKMCLINEWVTYNHCQALEFQL